jgi:hypothetical protein
MLDEGIDLFHEFLSGRSVVHAGPVLGDDAEANES